MARVTEEREPREATTTHTIRFAPLLRKLRREEWTTSVLVAPPAPPPRAVEAAEPPPLPPRVSKAIRFDAVTLGFVATRGTPIGKYVIEDKLGSGTFGSVYTARDRELDRRVAIKVLHPQHQTNTEVVTRFLQEAKVTARINHPGIVTLLEVGSIPTDLGDLAYIVMELLEGESLARRIDVRERLSVAEAIEICHQIAGALDAAHRADVLHRDVKPDNIFLVRDPVLANGERVKVLDFGLAKLGRGGHTMANTILGTPRYMSPEQTRSSAQIDARSDVYSLGCILFEVLVGRRPFGGDLPTLIEKHQRVIPPRLSECVPGIPAAIDELVARMLAKDPADRPQSMVEVQRALLACAAPAVGRSSVDQQLRAAASAAAEREPAPEPVADEPPLRTAVAFPPPPPPELDETTIVRDNLTIETTTVRAPSEDAGNVTMIVHPLPITARRFAIPRRELIAAGVVAALAIALGLARLLTTADAPAPAPAAAVPAPAAEPAAAEDPQITLEPTPVGSPTSIVRLRKPARTVAPPPVRTQRAPARKKPTRSPATRWDPNALFPTKR